MIEEVEYDVTLGIRVSIRIASAPIERDGPITRQDAIANAIGSLFTGEHDNFGGEYNLKTFFEDQGFSIAYPLDVIEATEVENSRSVWPNEKAT